MKSKVVKLTLERILEVLLSHGIQPGKIESIMIDLGVPQHHVERVLANIISLSKSKMRATKR
ncbi:MAG: hypothetical protein QXD66_05820 [Candidatus Nezhaarchaeales archaeon]|nr:MAG: hypothetical protein DSO06_04335 [Candidatus Nezhaarchaeota archaeon WYZ-LMO8]TDA36727.1 MAG: hypothetical protein DSO05_02485 [Candidatus Nezhaarchaeota archaeon WYZ-LMO7]